MNDTEIQDFVTRFAAAWAARDGEAFLALWHPDGVLHSPLYDRPVAGKELGLTELVRETAPQKFWRVPMSAASRSVSSAARSCAFWKR